MIKWFVNGCSWEESEKINNSNNKHWWLDNIIEAKMIVENEEEKKRKAKKERSQQNSDKIVKKPEKFMNSILSIRMKRDTGYYISNNKELHD